MCCRHQEYIVDGVSYMRLKFYVDGVKRKGIATIDLKKVTQEARQLYEFLYAVGGFHSEWHTNEAYRFPLNAIPWVESFMVCFSVGIIGASLSKPQGGKIEISLFVSTFYCTCALIYPMVITCINTVLHRSLCCKAGNCV